MPIPKAILYDLSYFCDIILHLQMTSVSHDVTDGDANKKGPEILYGVKFVFSWGLG